VARAKRAVPSLIAAGHAAAVIGVAVTGKGVCDTDGLLIVPPPRDETARILADNPATVATGQ
jgi:hypothetical protein